MSHYPGLLFLAGLERGGAGHGDSLILIAGTTADANRPYDLAIQLQGDTAAKIMILPLFEA